MRIRMRTALLSGNLRTCPAWESPPCSADGSSTCWRTPAENLGILLKRQSHLKHTGTIKETVSPAA